MKLYLLRHGQTEGNRRMLYYGTTNLPLLPEAETALRRNAARYPKVGRYYVSGMLRTVQTLRAIYGDVPYTVLPDLREIDFGIFEMHSYEELKDTPAYQDWILDAEHKPCPGGESAIQVQERSVRVIDRLLAKDEDALCISHGGTIGAIMLYYFGGIRFDYMVQPGQGVCLEAHGGKPERWYRIPEETK